MHYGNLFKIAFRALIGNKLRTLLTMLGIIIGVASVITMLAIGQGSKRSIANQISEMGSNMIMIQPGSASNGGVRMDAGSMQTLKLEDYYAIKRSCTLLEGVTPQVRSSGQLINGNNNSPSTLYGVTEDYLHIRKQEVDKGDIWSERDEKTAAKVCVIGTTVVENLFPDGTDPLDKVIRFNSIPFRIIGVLKSKGYNSMGQDQDDIVLAPYTTVMKRILAVTYLQGVTCSAKSEGETDKAIAQITETLRQRHKLRDGDDDDFTIRSQAELSAMMNSTTEMMTTLLACIAGISLIVGGIGIMNIEYVSVTERTKEIGLRMSVGARGIDIMAQFLIEAVIISVLGGTMGVLLGAIATILVNTIAAWPVYVEPWSVLLSFSVCVLTGIFFGWYPARKASSLNPIDAIRYE